MDRRTNLAIQYLLQEQSGRYAVTALTQEFQRKQFRAIGGSPFSPGLPIYL